MGNRSKWKGGMMCKDVVVFGIYLDLRVVEWMKKDMWVMEL